MNKSQLNKERAFSTDLAQHRGMIRNLARKCFGRVSKMRASVEFEDVYQELCISFVKASRTYDPSRGITFSAYFGKAAYNDFNRLAEKWEGEYQSVGLFSVEEFARGFSCDDRTNIGEVHLLSYFLPQELEEESIEDLCVRSDEIRERLASLSPLAKQVVRELISPSESIRKTLLGLQAHTEIGKRIGVRKYNSAPKTVDLRVIRVHFQIPYVKMRQLKRELSEKLGVDIE